MNKCPFFGICGGCKYNFMAPDYHAQKLDEIRNIPITGDPIWIPAYSRRRAEFAFADGKFGFLMHRSKTIVPITQCPLLAPEINEILPRLADLPWGGNGTCLVTSCDNGIDVYVVSPVPYFSTIFKKSAESIGAIRIMWNDKVVAQSGDPIVSFDNHRAEYTSGAFLQPTRQSEKILRDMVISAVGDLRPVADLFCGLGNFTFALNAAGFDINGIGIKRDLFANPLNVKSLNQFACVVMDPPRAGAMAQCGQIAKSNVKKIIYISCNPQTWMRDAKILTNGGYTNTENIPIDQFVGSSHWELFSIFEK